MNVPQKVPDISFLWDTIPPITTINLSNLINGSSLLGRTVLLDVEGNRVLASGMCAPVEKGRIPSVDSSVGPSRGETVKEARNTPRGAIASKCNLRPEARKSLQRLLDYRGEREGLSWMVSIDTS